MSCDVEFGEHVGVPAGDLLERPYAAEDDGAQPRVGASTGEWIEGQESPAQLADGAGVGAHDAGGGGRRP